MRKVIYTISVLLTAIALFWPVIYGNVKALHRLPGNPVVQALIGMILFGVIAYITFEEDGRETEAEGEFTAS